MRYKFLLPIFQDKMSMNNGFGGQQHHPPHRGGGHGGGGHSHSEEITCGVLAHMKQQAHEKLNTSLDKVEVWLRENGHKSV